MIQLDAHLDWTDQLGGNRLFNGHPMRYMSQLPYVDRMAHLGIHGIGSSKRSDFQDARAYGATILSARQIRAMGAQKVLEQLPQGGRYYVTIDIDAFDYSIAGGTGSPMLGGLLYDEAVDLLEGIAQLGEVTCVDLVEVSPPYDDAAGTTCYLAAGSWPTSWASSPRSGNAGENADPHPHQIKGANDMSIVKDLSLSPSGLQKIQWAPGLHARPGRHRRALPPGEAL